MAVISGFHTFRHPLRFPNEDAAHDYLRPLLKPYFDGKTEVWLKHGNNDLRIDYVLQPKPHTNFPFPLFGIEVKKGFDSGGDYNDALRQCVDYTQATINDQRATVLQGRQLERVYLFPGMPDEGWPSKPLNMFWVNRLIGKFHVGLIYEERRQGLYFTMCADRQWSELYGPIKRPHNIRHLLGSGVPRK